MTDYIRAGQGHFYRSSVVCGGSGWRGVAGGVPEGFLPMCRCSEEVSDVNTQRVGQLVDVVEGDVSLPAFDGANVGPMKTGALSQRLLAQPARLS